MTDRPILFSAPMVRALLAGTKTQTRRVIKPYRPEPIAGAAGMTALASLIVVRVKARLGGWKQGPTFKLPRVVGDRLWVRENWQALSFGDYLPTKDRVCDLRFAATDPLADMDKEARGYPWRPSIHMPRWASRLTLVVTAVHVQRLQDITEADAIAEGVERDTDGWRDYLMPETQCCATARGSYAALWDSINGPGAWDANPWVSVTSFTVHQTNIDSLAH